MTFSLKRAIAAAIPLAALASTSLASDAQQFGRIYHPFAVRPYATGAAVLGGGATLPIPAYLGLTESTGTTNFGKAGSLFGYFATVSGGLNVEYCATGSGKAKGIFDGPLNTVNNPCANAASATATVFGFLPPSGTPKQAIPTLAGTDAPLSSSDYMLFTTNRTSPAEPVELPSVFGAIAVYYHSAAGGTSRANVTTANLCGVYDGRIKTIGALLGTSDTTALTPVYRSDGSGTTFNFSNHLASVCASPDNGKYNGSQNTSGTAPIAFASLPTNAVGAKGNSGVIAAVAATNGAVGYAEAGYLTPAIAGTLASGTNYATVDGKNPITNLPEAANSIPSSALLSNVAVNQVNGAATTSPITTRSGSCLKVVAPSAYAKPSAGYSIIAVTYLLVNHTGNGTSGASALKTLENIINTPADFKNPSTSAPITTIDQAEPATRAGAGTTGYSSLGTSFNSALKGAASSCIGA